MLGKADLLALISSHAEDEIRAMLCRWLDCQQVMPCSEEHDPSSSTPKPAATMPTPILRVNGIISNDGFYFVVPLGPSGAEQVMMHLDTGAFEMLLTAEVADKLQLPNLGPLDVAGVTGNSSAYRSEVTVYFDADHVYEHVHCVVDPSYQGNPLFGFRFFIDHNLAVLVNPTQAFVDFYPAE